MESPLLFSLNFASLIYQLINAYDLLLIVRTASLANSVRHHQCTTFAALYQCRSAHFPVCSSLIASCFGRFILWADGHFGYTSLNLLNISLIAAIRGSLGSSVHPQGPLFRFFPHLLHIPLQSSLHKTFKGQLISTSR